MARQALVLMWTGQVRQVGDPATHHTWGRLPRGLQGVLWGLQAWLRLQEDAMSPLARRVLSRAWGQRVCSARAGGGSAWCCGCARLGCCGCVCGGASSPTCLGR